jgi:hypothetical protein
MKLMLRPNAVINDPGIMKGGTVNYTVSAGLAAATVSPGRKKAMPKLRAAKE